MRSLLSLIALPSLLFFSSCSAQTKNVQTTTVRIDGDCPMCEKTIEKAAFVKGEAEADWDVDVKTARITIDSTRTDVDAVLQRIAHAGYDNERYLAPDVAYAALPGCCQYERTFKRTPTITPDGTMDHSVHAHGHDAPPTDAPQTTGEALGPVFDAYFALKDALVASDAKKAAAQAAEFSAAVKAVPMEGMDADLHTVWMRVMELLANTSSGIASKADLGAQRKAFAELTEPMFALVKAGPGSTPIYLDHCPMYEGGADWLSRDKAIRNPFYGAQMMSCGSVKETIVK
jgi:copper chaperone CopZ